MVGKRGEGGLGRWKVTRSSSVRSEKIQGGGNISN